MHLAADPSRHPTRVPAGLGCVDRGNQWDIEELGQRDGRVGDQPVVRVHDVRTPRLGASAGGLQRQPGPSHRVAHRERPGHHVGAEVELVRVMCGGDHPHALGDLVGRGMRAGVGVRGATAEHHDFVPGRGQRRRQLVDVPSEPADHHRRVLPRHHQNFHGRSILRERAQNAALTRRVGVQTRTLAGRGEVMSGGAFVRPVRRTGRRRGSSRPPAARPAHGGPMPAHPRSPGWRAHADVRGSGRSRPRSPC